MSHIPTFDELMARKTLGDLSTRDALQAIGQLVDLAGDLGNDDGTERALEWADAVGQRSLTDIQTAILEYFRANAWGHRQDRRRRESATSVWEWEQPELQRQVFHLRRAVRSPGFGKMAWVQQCQILTNLGNQLNTVGRFVDATEYWSRALILRPRFGMALGNLGYGLHSYARSLYDPGHQRVFLRFSHEHLSAALSPAAEYETDYAQAKEFFRSLKEHIESLVDVKRIRRAFNMDDHSLGRSKGERRYRQWCLQNRLFLNPLNDLGPYPIAAHDVLMLPNYTTPIGESPTLLAFFNQMKQEFASARWLLYEGLHDKKIHFSDRGVALYNTLDYPSYSLAVEKTKAAFRATYSLLDKVAYFLNDYMRLSISDRDVYFRGIWFRPRKGGGRSLRNEFERAENWPLRGLYWLAKDFVERDFQEVMEPDAHALVDIRNRMEHGYLKLHEILADQADAGAPPDPWRDRLAYSVQRSDFEKKTLRILKLARAALTYLSLGMHQEERLRARGGGGNLVAPMHLGLWDDRWKR